MTQLERIDMFNDSYNRFPSTETIYPDTVEGLELEMTIQMTKVTVQKLPWYLKLFLNPKVEEVLVKGKIKSIGTNFISVEWES